MKDIFTIDFRDSIRKVVRRELKEKFNIKAPKEKDKQYKIQLNGNPFQVFGASLECVPSKNVKDDQYFAIPVFLADSFEYLNDHVKVEGLFRKSGSLGRQKMLREIVEKEGTCCSCDFVQPHDIASIIKQFFRELPDPLLTNKLSATFLKCITLTSMSDAVAALNLCCLLLPDEHLRLLHYFTKFMSKVANHSLQSKMTLTNLSIVFAPNLMSTLGKEKNSEKSMKETTQVVDLLFKNCDSIGMVPDDLYVKASELNTDDGFYSSSGDELENNDENGRHGRTLARSDKKRDRSRSITGFLKKSFKPPEKYTPRPSRHARSRSEKASPVGKGRQLLQKKTSFGDVSAAQNFGGSVPSIKVPRQSSKRVTRSNTNLSPVRKSPRHSKEQVNPTISTPVIKTLPHQVALTPRRYLQPIQRLDNQDGSEKLTRTGVSRLPSKFDFNTTKQQDQSKNGSVKSTSSRHKVNNSQSKLYRSQSTNTYMSSTTTDKGDITDSKLPSSRLSRSTQKPHVKKSRRTSSMNRRRERYASGCRVQRQLPKTPPPLNYSVLSPSEFNDTIAEEDRIRKNETLSLQDLRSKTQANKVTTTINNKSRSRVLKKSASVLSPLVENNVPRTPVNRTNLQRSASSTSSRKSSTPYNVTPHVGVRRKRPIIEGL